MPFRIERNDIVRMKTDAIVNTANPEPLCGSGTDRAIYTAAGMDELLAARREIGPIAAGDAAVTPGFSLPAKYIIHTVGPFWVGGTEGEVETLRSCVTRSLDLARDLGCESIAFPLLSTGNNGFPKDLALRTTLSAFSDWLMQDGNEMFITLTVFDRESADISGKVSARLFGPRDGGLEERSTRRTGGAAAGYMPGRTTRHRIRRPGGSTRKQSLPRFCLTQKKEVPTPGGRTRFSVCRERTRFWAGRRKQRFPRANLTCQKRQGERFLMHRLCRTIFLRKSQLPACRSQAELKCRTSQCHIMPISEWAGRLRLPASEKPGLRRLPISEKPGLRRLLISEKPGLRRLLVSKKPGPSRIMLISEWQEMRLNLRHRQRKRRRWRIGSGTSATAFTHACFA